jgi:radical SAM superfamily enzyme YgiQ (UPF0313 family)
MIKFLWINAIDSSSEVETRYPNLGIGYLVASLKKFFGDDAFVFQVVNADIDAALDRFNPDVVGISAVSQNYGRAVRYADEVYQRGIPVLVGGVHISFLPETLSHAMTVGCIGEGEDTIIELMQIFRDVRCFEPKLLAGIAGIIYHAADGSLLKTQPRPPQMNLDMLAVPDRSLFKESSHTYLFTSRGCPYRCSFCASSRFWDSVRFFSAERVVSEVEMLVEKSGASFISFFDDLFVADKKRFFKIVDLLEQGNVIGKVKFSCSLRANTVTEDIVSGLKRMGVVSVGMGLESGNQRVLTWLKGAGITVEQNRRAVALLQNNGIMANASFVIGAPDETETEIQDTLKFIKSVGLGLFDVYVLTPFPGTPVWDLAKSRGLVSEGADMDWSSLNVNFEVSPHKAIILSEVLSRSEIVRLYGKFRRYRLFHNVMMIWRHPMLADLPRYAFKLLREKIRRIGQ